MRVYKQHLLEALETEPLDWGNWVRKPSNSFGNVSVKEEGCRSCAIGSVFRKYTTMTTHDVQDAVEDVIGCDGIVSPETIEIQFNFSDYDDEGTLKLPTSWLEAISLVWESMKPGDYHSLEYDTILPRGIERNIEEARWHMIDWVEENVPEDTVLWRIKA